MSEIIPFAITSEIWLSGHSGQMLNLMKKIGPEEALAVFEAAIIDLEKGTDPNVYG